MEAIEEVIDTKMVLRKPFLFNDLAFKVQQALTPSGMPSEPTIII
jgi:hypothetical protein